MEREQSESTKTLDTSFTGGPTNIDNERVANPPARTIRFDGHEAILGNGISAVLSSSDLRTRLKPLIEKDFNRSAKRLILQYGETSERVMAERWTADAADKDIKLIAAIRSKRSCAAVKTDWNSLLKVAQEFPVVAQEYHRQRSAFVAILQSGEPDEHAVAQLKKASSAVVHPMIEMDCLRLLGLNAVVAEQWRLAEDLYRQSLAVAVRSNNLQYRADLHLLLAEAAKRSGDSSNAIRNYWLEAISDQIEIMKLEPTTLDIEFWLRIEQILPEPIQWPENVTEAFLPFIADTLAANTRSHNTLFWTAIAQSQMARNEMQLALLNLKKAQMIAWGDDVMSLRIAEIKCLASIGQTDAAVAVLSGPATHSHVAVVAAAMAALGSVKLQSGAYQQGTQLLIKAMKKSADAEWPSKTNAMADLAIAQLIVGSTAQGLSSLHNAQARFQASGDISTLIHSLENEARLLDHEEKKSDRAIIEQRIVSIEASWYHEIVPEVAPRSRLRLTE